MVKFHGDLLLGGTAIRNLNGVMKTEAKLGGTRWTGCFLVDIRNQSMLELGRPYLLLLDDGRSGRVIVTQWQEKPDHHAVEVQFQTLN